MAITVIQYMKFNKNRISSNNLNIIINISEKTRLLETHTIFYFLLKYRTQINN